MPRRKWLPGMYPQGEDLVECVNKDIPICPDCGAVLERREDVHGGCDIFVCVECGYDVDEMDYEYQDSDGPSYQSGYSYDD